MGNFYARVGNRTLKNEEYYTLTAEEKQELIEEGERANRKRLENMRKGLGLEPQQGVTLDVTPEGIAKRNEAIKIEEAKLASEEATEEVKKSSKGKKSKAAASEE